MSACIRLFAHRAQENAKVLGSFSHAEARKVRMYWTFCSSSSEKVRMYVAFCSSPFLAVRMYRNPSARGVKNHQVFHFDLHGSRYIRTSPFLPCECIAVRAPAPPSLCECIAVRAKRRPRLRYIRTAPHSPCECIAVRAPRSSKTGHFLHTDLQEVARKSFKIVVRLISATAPRSKNVFKPRPL